jgi:hypothetical protein
LARAAEGVEFIDEDDAGRRLTRLLEEIANAGGTDTDEHFDELRTRYREEGDAESILGADKRGICPKENRTTPIDTDAPMRREPSSDGSTPRSKDTTMTEIKRHTWLRTCAN